ncbi:MAG TPA: hypothetical protein VGM29_19495 [Polyangiaceae bacterium]
MYVAAGQRVGTGGGEEASSECVFVVEPTRVFKTLCFVTDGRQERAFGNSWTSSISTKPRFDAQGLVLQSTVTFSWTPPEPGATSDTEPDDVSYPGIRTARTVKYEVSRRYFLGSDGLRPLGNAEPVPASVHDQVERWELPPLPEPY